MSGQALPLPVRMTHDGPMSSHFVIAGGGLAAARTAASLRERGSDARLTIIGDEPHLPYERPPLSKGYLLGTEPKDSVFVHDAAWYREHEVELRLGVRACGLDARRHTLALEDGSDVRYDKLLIATGSSPRRLDVPGSKLDGVHLLRRLEDSDRLRAALERAHHAVIVGAGWIGLETASAARAHDVEVTIVEAGDLPLVRVLGAEVAQVFADLHRAHGVDLRFNAQLDRIEGVDGIVTGVVLADGTRIDADLVIVGIGITPNTELAEDAGLAVRDGIVVDEHLCTSHPDVLAAGDVASAFHPFWQRHIRVEHWANADRQPKVAAATMLGIDEVYDRQPFFFSDQYDLGLEYTGYAAPGDYDQVVVRGDTEQRAFIAFWLSSGRVLAGMNVNVWNVADAIAGLIESRREVDVERLENPDVPFSRL